MTTSCHNVLENIAASATVVLHKTNEYFSYAFASISRCNFSGHPCESTNLRKSSDLTSAQTQAVELYNSLRGDIVPHNMSEHNLKTILASLKGSQLLEKPRTSQSLPPPLARKLPRDFPRTSLTVDLRAMQRLLCKFPRLPRKFPGLPRRFPGTSFSGKPFSETL